MYDVMDVARFIVNYSIQIVRPVSNLKLQKLLYFIQVAFISNYGISCFKEPIVHWRHGPVVESVYQKYKTYGAENITEFESVYFQIRFDIQTMSFMTDQCFYDENIFKPSHLLLMKAVVESYKDKSPWDMVELTHKEAAWRNTNRNEEITVDMIKRYYS
mgnify:CR=1 FL=1